MCYLDVNYLAVFAYDIRHGHALRKPSKVVRRFPRLVTISGLSMSHGSVLTTRSRTRVIHVHNSLNEHPPRRTATSTWASDV
jgi:hypothetical protein